MATRSTRKSITRSHATPLVVPSDAPAWVTPEMIEKTLKVWQPYYEQELIPEDALAIIMGVGRILEFLTEGSDETIRRPSSRQQP